MALERTATTVTSYILGRAAQAILRRALQGDCRALSDIQRDCGQAHSQRPCLAAMARHVDGSDQGAAVPELSNRPESPLPIQGAGAEHGSTPRPRASVTGEITDASAPRRDGGGLGDVDG